MNRIQIPATGKAVVLALCLPLLSCTPKEAAQENPRVTLHDKIQRRPIQVKGCDNTETYLLDTLFRDVYHQGIIKLYALRSHAPWARLEEQGMPGVVWEGAEPVDPDYQNAPEKAVEQYRDLKFGVRIIFGLFQHFSKDGYSGQHSWESWYVNKSDGQYTMGEQECVDFLKRYYTTWQDFNPVNFDGNEWGELFKEAGFKFAVLTAKNHDGFSIFHTQTKIPVLIRISDGENPQYTTAVKHFSIEDSPYKKDLLKEYAEGLRKNGIAVGFYFSNPDWMDYDARFGSGNIFRDPAYTRESDLEGYLRFANRHRQQLVELCSNYGKIDILSFDHGLPHSLWPEFKVTLKEIRRLQPDVMMRRRGIGNYGDFFTPEGSMPADSKYTRPWCVIGVSGNTAPAQDIINRLLYCVSLNGSFQWNCSPDKTGKFSPETVEKMKDVGAWLKINGEAIYSTRGWVRAKEDNIYFTSSKDGAIVNAILTEWPGNGETITIKTFAEKDNAGLVVLNVSLLGYDNAIKWNHDEEGLKVTFPEKQPCNYAYALKIYMSTTAE